MKLPIAILFAASLSAHGLRQHALLRGRELGSAYHLLRKTGSRDTKRDVDILAELKEVCEGALAQSTALEEKEQKIDETEEAPKEQDIDWKDLRKNCDDHCGLFDEDCKKGCKCVDKCDDEYPDDKKDFEKCAESCVNKNRKLLVHNSTHRRLSSSDGKDDKEDKGMRLAADSNNCNEESLEALVNNGGYREYITIVNLDPDDLKKCEKDCDDHCDKDDEDYDKCHKDEKKCESDCRKEHECKVDCDEVYDDQQEYEDCAKHC